MVRLCYELIGGADLTDTEIEIIENKKRWLKRYKKNMACINRLETKLYELTNRIETIRTSNLSGMPRGGQPITLDEMLSDKIELENRISRLKTRRLDLKAEIIAAIDTLDDPRHCEILESFFIDGYTLEQIAEKENYTTRHVYRLYSEGVKLIALNQQ